MNRKLSTGILAPICYNNNMLTKRQKQILDFITQYNKRRGVSPALEEIKRHFRLRSVSNIHQHIDALKNKGYLNKAENQPRGIEVRKPIKSPGTINIPLLGVITAGEPVEAYEVPESIIVSKDLIPKGGDYFALEVNGNSMIGEGIFDGDKVIIRKQQTAENGETVVALINGSETTLKKIYREKNGFRLQPANPKLKPIFVKELEVQGKVVSVIRNLNEAKEVSENVVAQKREASQEKNLEKHLNKIFLGDIMELLKKLPAQSVDMVFGDPDYNVGRKYGEKRYTKTFDEYIEWYIELTKESLRVLKPHGNLFMINYPRQNAHLWTKFLDRDYPLTSEYVWVYNTNVGHTPQRFTTAHRTILHVRKSKRNKFYKENVALPYKNPNDKRILKNLENGSKGRMPYSWLYFDLVKNVSKEKTLHACQIPQQLIETLIRATTKPSDIVLILFGGSGAELEVCKNLGRQYISAEIDPKYHEIIADRLKRGYIQEKYKLKLRNGAKNNYNPPLIVFNKEGLFSLPGQR